MKYFSFLIISLSLSSCSKDEVYEPHHLKNGQEVELLVDHRYESDDEQLLILPKNQASSLSVHGFSERKPGYVYHVMAKFNVTADLIQDAPDRWFNVTKIISEEKYQGNETFGVSLIKSIVPGGPVIYLTKKDGQYQYIQDKLELTPNSQIVKDQLEEIWLNAKEIRDSWSTREKKELKWKLIKATVTHDPDKFGKAYLVHRIEFIN